MSGLTSAITQRLQRCFRDQLCASLLLLGVGAVASALYVGYAYLSFNEMIRQRLAHTFEAADRALVSTIDESRYLADGLSNKLGKYAHDLKAIERIVQVDYKGQTGENTIGWVDTKKQWWLNGWHGLVTNPIDLSDREYLKRAFEHPHQLVISEPIRGRSNKKPIIAFNRGVFNEKQEFVGVVAAYLPLYTLNNAAAEAVHHPGIRFGLYFNDSVEVMHSAGAPGFFENVAPVLKQMGGDTSYTPSWLGETGDFIYRGALSSYPYSLVLAYDRNLAYSELISLITPKLLLVSVGLGCMMVLIWAINRNANKVAATNIAQVITDMAQGKVEKIELPEAGSHEMMLIAETLGGMHQSIQQLHKEKDAIALYSELRKRQSRFLVHDMRAHTNIVCTFADLIESNAYGLPIHEKYSDYARDIRNSGIELTEMANEILDIEKSRNGKLKLNRQSIPPAEIIEEAVSCIRRKAELRRVELEVTIADNAPELYADPKRLKRMIQNLVTNSLKFTKKGGRICISYSANEDGAPVIEVSDNGVGMNGDDIHIAVGEYGQVSGEAIEQHEGSGLGLPFVKEMVEEHGGNFSIHSEKDVGTRIQLTFRRRDARVDGKPKLTLVAS